MGLLIGYLVMFPVIVFWSIVTVQVFRKSERLKVRMLSILFLLVLMVSPIFSEYNSQQNIEYIIGHKKCKENPLQDYETDSFHLTDTNNNGIIELTKKE